MSGALVISLDFEMMWGVRDRRSIADYGDAVLGGRAAIPQMLDRFVAAGVHATWATVGLLFARTRRDMMDCAPAPADRPTYADPRLSPYASMDEVGEDEAADPYHFGRSLIARIADTPGQEVATHTYAHYCCLEPGQTPAQFEADLRAAIAVAQRDGVGLRSIVFPRNQAAWEHLDACYRLGLAAYRGNQPGFGFAPRGRDRETALHRACRLLDSLVPLGGDHSHTLPVAGARPGQPANVPASRFFRPARRDSMTAQWQIEVIKREMTHAARRGRLYHLWWHPHNFGRATELNLARLDAVLAHFVRLRDEHGFTCRSMAELAAEAGEP